MNKNSKSKKLRGAVNKQKNLVFTLPRFDYIYQNLKTQKRN